MSRSDDHILDLLDDYGDGVLPPAERQTADDHLRTCADCRAALARHLALAEELAALPRAVEPPRDLWPELAARLTPPPVLDGRADRPAQPPARMRPARWRMPAVLLAAVVVVGVALAWFGPRLTTPSWTVARLEGTPRIGQEALGEAGTLRPGEWLETDARSSAVLDVGLIGNVEVGPSTRLQLRAARPTDHRLALAEGSIYARIWAPPRLFIVETPAATAIDLGCEYTLTVDSTGAGLLHVTSGYVALEKPGRAVVVPAGAMARLWPGLGPGTPFDEAATPAFQDALDRLDTDGAEAATLPTLLAEARAADAATLWHLLFEIDESNRGMLYDRLASLVGPPAGVTREGTLSGAPRMLETWHLYLGLHDEAGPSFEALKKKKKKAKTPS